MNDLLKQVEEETGFKSYESAAMPDPQYTFYGLNSNLAAFKAKVANKIPTGTIAYCVDVKTNEMYYAPTNSWY